MNQLRVSPIGHLAFVIDSSFGIRHSSLFKHVRMRLNRQPKELPVPQEIHQHTFGNGLTLLAENMPHVRSAALNFLVAAGCVYDPPDRLGIAAVLSDLITRGAGEHDSRALSL